MLVFLLMHFTVIAAVLMLLGLFVLILTSRVIDETLSWRWLIARHNVKCLKFQIMLSLSFILIASAFLVFYWGSRFLLF